MELIDSHAHIDSPQFAEDRDAMLERARRTIPLGAQTFSKSTTQFPLGVSPYFAARAKACIFILLESIRKLTAYIERTYVSA